MLWIYVCNKKKYRLYTSESILTYKDGFRPESGKVVVIIMQYN